MQWFASTAVTSSLVLILNSFALAGPAEDAANAAMAGHAATLNTPTPGAAAGTQNYYEYVKPKYGDSAALNENGLKPITQASPLKSIKGASLGTVGFMQSTNKPLLRVTMVPELITGNIAVIAIEQDLNASGVIDYTASIGGGGQMISGVCANGAILCAPGTFDGLCSYERWDTDNNGGITTSSRLGTPTTKNDLFNCYCFSNYCSRFNNAASLNLAQIDQELAGSLLAIFMEKRPDLIVSSVSATDGVVSYFGTKSGSMSKADGYTAPQKPNRDYSKLPAITANTPDVAFGYYTDSGALDAATTAENTAMAANPNSLYSIVNNLQKNSGSAISTCTNFRSVSLYNKSVTASASTSGTFSTDHWVYSRMTSNDLLTFNVEFSGASQGSPNTYTPVYVGSVSPPTSATALNFQASNASYSCPYHCIGNCSGNPMPGTGSAFWAPGLGMPTGWSPGSAIMSQSSVQTVSVDSCNFTVGYTEEGTNESITNGCSALESDTACKLQDEKWDDRPYIANFLQTGFQMAQICTNYPGVLRNYNVCKPWMKQQRTYVCDRNVDNSFNAFLTQLRPQVKATQDASIVPPGTGSGLTCEISCKTKVVRRDTEVRNLSVESNVKQPDSVAQNAYDYFIKQCSVSNGSSVCPVDSTKGETVVKDCGCINDFGEALARTDAINKAANDTICSSVQQQ